MPFVAPEVVVLSVSWSGVPVCMCMRVHSCGGLLYRQVGPVGWAASAASVWALESLKICPWWSSWLGGWAL